jgi:hypothetical protein
MGDAVEAFKTMRELRQERHSEWFEKNMAALRAAGLLARDRVALRSTAVLFREYGRPKVDFYPHTGRWRIVGAPCGASERDPRPMRGGAEAFVRWYAKQGVRPEPTEVRHGA